jgi:hypothetical protein
MGEERRYLRTPSGLVFALIIFAVALSLAAQVEPARADDLRKVAALATLPGFMVGLLYGRWVRKRQEEGLSHRKAGLAALPLALAGTLLFRAAPDLAQVGFAGFLSGVLLAIAFLYPAPDRAH